MARGIPVMVLAALAAMAWAVAPASAANQSVVLEHDEFEPKRVAVQPGEKVSWTNPDAYEAHNVHFEDGSFVEPFAPEAGPWTVEQTFMQAGAFQYYCEIHGAAGGVGMSGTVYVNAGGSLPPTASAGASPSVARVGQTVTFSAAGSQAAAGRQIVKYEWDLDGDGGYEQDTGATPTASRSYAGAGTVSVAVRVTDDAMLTDVATFALRVTFAPAASFSISPSPATTGQTVNFDASTSSDSDGTISLYEWDLDGNGSFETVTGATPAAARAYTTPATVTVGLRVTDDAGVATGTTRTLQVTAASGDPAAARPPQRGPNTTTTPTAPAASAARCGALDGAERAACMQRACSSVSRSRRAACFQRSCRYVARGKRAACVRKSCRWTSRAKKSACMKKSCRWLKGSKKRACLRKYSPRR